MEYTQVVLLSPVLLGGCKHSNWGGGVTIYKYTLFSTRSDQGMLLDPTNTDKEQAGSVRSCLIQNAFKKCGIASPAATDSGE